MSLWAWIGIGFAAWIGANALLLLLLVVAAVRRERRSRAPGADAVVLPFVPH